jgi:hypothetical protein
MRVSLDTKVLSIISGKEIHAEDLMPLYNLLDQEAYHWGTFESQGVNV